MPVLSISKKSNSFCVNNEFVDKYMCDANGSYVKVYLYCLCHSEQGDALSVAKIASLLNMISSDVISALKYWDSVGVVKFEKNEKNDYSVEFYSEFDQKDKEPVYSTGDDGEKKIVPAQTTYARADITTAMHGNERIRQLFTLSSQLLNKTLNNNDMNIIYMFYDYLKLPPEVIFMLLEYCVSVGKSNMRYIEKVALTWADEEINTTQKASAFIRARNKENMFLQKYKEMFKITGRDFTDTEVTLLKTWVNEYKLSDADIMEAYDLTIINTGKLAFRYMDTVIKNKISGNDKVSRQPAKRNTFSDYGSDGYDLETAMTLRTLTGDK